MRVETSYGYTKLQQREAAGLAAYCALFVSATCSGRIALHQKLGVNGMDDLRGSGT